MRVKLRICGAYAALILSAALLPLTSCTKMVNPPRAPAPVAPTLEAATALRGEAIVELGSRSVKGRAIIIAKAPDQFRMDVVAALGRAVFIVAASSKECDYYADGKLRPCGKRMQELGLELTSVEVVSILTGAVPPSQGSVLWKLGKPGPTLVAVKYLDNKEVARVESSGRGFIQGYAIPRSVVIHGPVETLAVEFDSVEVEPEGMGPGAFSIKGD